MKFQNRESELKLIKDAISQKYCFLVLTGRRRIGKTRLIREALKDKKHIELFIPRKRLTLALQSVKDSIKDQTGYAPEFKNFKDVFEYLFRVEKKIVFIDEISNLSYVEPGIFSELQQLIDKEKDNLNIKLLVDGSYIGVMKTIFTDKKEPLFGRATNYIELQKLRLEHSLNMCMDAGFKFLDALEAYSLLGGVPRYLELLSQYKNIKDLKKQIFSIGSIFLIEGENVLIQEFGSAWDTYFSILEVIAKGKLGPSAIASQLGMPIQMIPKYLENLQRLQLIRRKKPILGVERHVRYQICDPFFQFWFDVCYPKLGQYRDGTLIVPEDRISSAIGKGMEQVIQELIKTPKILPIELDDLGSWWDRSGHEIDVLGYSKKLKTVIAGEVKWNNKQVTVDDVEQLLNNIKMVDWYNDKRKEYMFIFSKSGFTERAEQLMVIKNISRLGVKELEEIIQKNKKIRWT
jgi:AAA+ ATPase superfamily predicted ATPase